MLVGNKIDLEASRQVSTSEATEYAAEVNAVHVELTASDYSGSYTFVSLASHHH
jgi:hypothetical protein